MIATRPGLSRRALAADLGVVPSRVVTLVDHLDGKGLVERRRSTEDRRNQQGLTPGVHPGYRNMAKGRPR
ncbi:MarR family transcriptional regulator [Streptomyces rectiverticillatus]|nr:MarR family transcriptional regulator [Streptomyces rectiverticillatus]QLE75423.1 MarR family transcriptional regulator [Streptomyces rectiverticillatus]